jgi:prepilin-type N-terminal cleavage/methylation domain-containing protein
MRFCSENIACSGGFRRWAAGEARRGFSLAEVMAALAILALIASSVLVVIDRCVTSATDSALKMQAFEVARENMEKLLASDSAKEMSEYGQSEQYPDISWETVVETFYEPITSRMWIRAVCSGSYTDWEGEEQRVELTHWLTDLTKEQLLEIAKQREREQEGLGEDIVESVEEAAEYAGVEEETIEQWVEDGMPTEPDGTLNKRWLELYKKTGGSPTSKQVEEVKKSIELAWQQRTKGPDGSGGDEPVGDEAISEDEALDRIDPATGLTYRQEMNMTIEELWPYIVKQNKK